MPVPELLQKLKPWVRGALSVISRRYVRRVRAADSAFISEFKHSFDHSEREFVHNGRRYLADSLYCHAVPGTLEICLLELKELRNAVSGSRGRLLNLGGGTGQVTRILEHAGFEVTNTDIEVANENQKNIRFDLNAPAELPFADEFFDFVLCQEVIEHVENPWRLFRLVWRVLRSEGYLLLTTPNIHSTFSKRIFVRSNYFHWFTPDCFAYHINALPVWEIELIAQKTGFRVARLRGNSQYYFPSAGVQPRGAVLADNECLIFVLQKAA